MMNWTKTQSKEEIINFLNSHPKMLKVLAKDKVLKVLAKDKAKDNCEGVFVYVIEGDDNNGVGFLLSNIVIVNHDAMRGDMVQYQTKNPKEKPYITTVVAGSGN